MCNNIVRVAFGNYYEQSLILLFFHIELFLEKLIAIYIGYSLVFYIIITIN